MHPLTIATHDYLVVSFSDNSKTTPQLITAVSLSVVNNIDTYAVTAGGLGYTCTIANTTLLKKTTPDTSSANTPVVGTWVLGA